MLQETAKAIHQEPRADHLENVSEATVIVKLVREKQGDGKYGRSVAHCSSGFPDECPLWLTGWLSGREMANGCGALISREAERKMRARKTAAQ